MAAYYREAIAEGLKQFDKGQNDDSLYDALAWEGLYAIDKFFVEVEWNIEKEKIVGKGEFKYGHTLDRYSNVPKEI